ncbi:long-chain fatty acid transporter [Agrobacterium vitis]|uniref:OmpP1/FadL family transporter n=1 Tax=Agrobacterium vitis TaxID=373 RepID=UPI0012E77775|nr:outer membrane protein transport protein [Agrobacterium vitis]MVA73107.1 long-chain fatty acid transporter [Agrobacterium vitis]
MSKKQITLSVLALVATALSSTAALAGGFSRGEADTDILYEDGKVKARAGAVFVSPERKYDTVGGSKSSDGSFSDSYWIPSVAAKVQISDAVGCAFTYTQPFGASSTYGTDTRRADQLAGAASGNFNYYTKKHFITNEYGGTCAVRFDVGPGKLYVLGGGFFQDFDYTADSYYGTLHLKDNSSVGYRLGVGYDIPEYAMRAQLMYRSQIKEEADGDFTPRALSALLGTGAVSADGYGTLPQSLKLSLQSGIAAGWLAYGSVKWTDWSVLQTLNYNITGLGAQRDDFFWKDGWTIQAGIGHKFNDRVSGTVNITWDKGVGNGADIMTDTWTLGVGTEIKLGPGDLRVGAGVSYLTAGSQSYSKGASYDATANGDWAYAFGSSYQIKF